MQTLRGFLAALVVGVAATLVIVALAILPFLNPVWVGFAQERAQATAWTGWTSVQLATVTDAVLADLVVGPPDFDVTLDGAAVLDQRERDHMTDVRNVFAMFYLAAIIAAGVLVAAFLLSRRPEARAVLWHRLSRTGLIIVIVTVVGGVLGLLFFDQAFELFHTIFFPAGSYNFDPGSERLVQLFPQQFWIESTIGVGVVIVVLSLLLNRLAARRASAPERAA